MAEPNPEPTPTPSDPPVDPPVDPPKDPAADPPSDPKSIVDDDPDPKSDALPDNWREIMAGGDEKLLKNLQRYTTPANLAKSWLEQRQKLSSGDYKKALPPDPTEEELAAWRQENGVPESPDKYEVKLPDDAVLEEEDQPLVDSFKQMAHEANLPNEAVNTALNWYVKFAEDARVEQAAKDQKFKEDAIEELRSEWGGEYKANINAVKTMLGDFGQELFGARLTDGSLLGNHPGFLKWAAQIAREMNPSASLLPGGSNNIEGINSEIDKIRDVMRKDPNKYWKDEGMQNRFAQLLAAQEKLSSRE